MRLHCKLALLLIALSISFSAQSQNDSKLDSLLRVVSLQKDTVLAKTYIEIFNAKFIKSPKEAKMYLDSASQIANDYNDKRLNSKLLLAKATLFHRTGKTKKAEEGYKEAILVFEQLNDKKNLSNAYNNLGLTQSQLAKFKEALHSYMKSLRLKEELNVKAPNLLKSYANIGILHKNTENYDLAIEYLRKAEEIAAKEEFKAILKRELAMIRASMAQVYAKTKQYNKSLKNYFESMKYFEDSKNTKAMATTYENLGWLYEQTDSLSKAEFYYKKSLKLCEQKDEKLSCSLIYLGLGRINLIKKKYPAALSYLNQALETSESTGQDEETMRAYKSLATTHAALGNYKKAYTYETIHFKKYDNIFKAENIKKINEISIQYQTEKKEQQIAQQETEINLLEEQEKVSNLQKMLLGSGLGLSLLTIGFGFYGFQQRTKRNQLEKEKIDAELQLKESELAFKKKELTTHALHLAKKNEVLEDIKQKAKELKTSENGNQGYQQLIHTINFDQQDDKNWENFTQYFEQVHKDFGKKVKEKYPEVTKNELRLMALLKMNLSSKEIANILNISSDGVKKARQRLRKKMELSPEESLEATVLTM